MIIDNLRLIGLGGSNKVMQGELSRLARRALTGERSRELLGVPPKKDGTGGLIYPFAPDLAAIAVGYHRTAARVLWDLCESSATRLEPLYEEVFEALAADRRPYLDGKRTISVHAFGSLAVAAGERQIVGTVKNAFIDAATSRATRLEVDAENPDLVVHVRSAAGGERTIVSLDLAGRPMHERGYRLRPGAAPLREDLAANLVMLTRHDARREPMLDPMAGSGTLLIEAALLAAGQPLWMSRRTPLAAKIDPIGRELALHQKALFGDTKARVGGCEIDDEAYDILQRAADTAGVQGEFHHGDFYDWNPSEDLTSRPGVILTNPPYGARLDGGNRALGELYEDLGAWCHTFEGWRAGFIVGESDDGPSSVQLFLRSFGGEPRVKKPIRNGPLRAMFLLYDL